MLSKQFRTNRVSLGIKSRPNVLDEQHFINETVKLAYTFLLNFKKVVSRCSFVQCMLRNKMLSVGRILVFTYALM